MNLYMRHTTMERMLQLSTCTPFENDIEFAIMVAPPVIDTILNERVMRWSQLNQTMSWVNTRA